MSLDVFNQRIDLIKSYADKLNREKIPMDHQLILIKSYGRQLKINLTSNMLMEILG